MDNLKKTTTLFKFMSVRQPDELKIELKKETTIQLETETVSKLLKIINSKEEPEKKAKDFNSALKAYIDSEKFINSEADLEKPNSSIKAIKGEKSSSQLSPETLYDNIVVKTLINNANNKLFKLISDKLKEITLNGIGNKELIIDDIEILMPKGLIPVFSSREAPQKKVVKQNNPVEALAKKYETLLNLRADILSKETQSNIPKVTQASTKRKMSSKGVTSEQVPAKPVVIRNLALEEVNKSINGISNLLIRSIPQKELTLIGNKWVDVSQLESAIKNPAGGTSPAPIYCDIEFPLAVADLRVVEQEIVGYLPGEIAHINNTEKGSSKERTTTRTLKTDTFESLMTENEVFSERDTQTTERFSLEKEAADAQNQETAININASVSGSYGPVKAEVSAGYSSTTGSTASQSNAQSYSKETVEKAIDRVTSKVKQERSTRTIEEFIELNSAKIDLREQLEKHSVAIYRWLNKLTRATLKNYGKRLIVEIGIAHPAHYYIWNAISSQKASQSIIILPDNPALDTYFSIDNITPQNYLTWGEKYNAKLEQPPANKILISKQFNAKDSISSGDVLTITEEYQAKRACITYQYGYVGSGSGQVRFLVGKHSVARYDGTDNPFNFALDDEEGSLPYTVFGADKGIWSTLEVECELPYSNGIQVSKAWQIKTYHAIIAAYETLKAEAESKQSEFDPNLPGLPPLKKKEVIKTELKKACFNALYKCEPFWATDDFIVGEEYNNHCCYDHNQSQKVKFLDGLFDFDNMSYELHDYFWADKDNWKGLLALTDDDEHFEKFLQASYATVRLPVHRNKAKEIAALNFIANNSIENYETLIPEFEDFIEELKVNETEFTVGVNGEDIAIPSSIVDLGYYQLPTNLIILESDADGITINEDPDIAANFFSPAIIQKNP